MIKNTKPLSMPEVMGYLNSDNKEELIGFIKKFNQIKTKDSTEMRKKLEDLNLIKMKEEHLVKVIDFLPITLEELNKIFVDVSLDEDEAKKIVDIVGEYK